MTAPADFSLSLSFTDLAVARGSTNALAVQTAAVSGPPVQVDVGDRLPAGVTASFLPARVVAGGNSTLTLSASSSAALVASAAFTVVATSAGAVHTLEARLSVTGTPGIPDIAVMRPAAGPVSGMVEIEVDASPATGANLSRIEVFVDGSSVGSSTSAPARILWPSAQVLDGTHALTAKATDDDGGTATTGPISLDVLNSASSDVGGKGQAGRAAPAGARPLRSRCSAFFLFAPATARSLSRFSGAGAPGFLCRHSALDQSTSPTWSRTTAPSGPRRNVVGSILTFHAFITA